MCGKGLRVQQLGNCTDRWWTNHFHVQLPSPFYHTLTGNRIYGSAEENAVGFSAHPDYCFSFVFSVIKRGGPLLSHWTHFIGQLFGLRRTAWEPQPPPMITTKILGRHFLLESLLWRDAHSAQQHGSPPYSSLFQGTHTKPGDKVSSTMEVRLTISPFPSSDHIILSPEVQNINQMTVSSWSGFCEWN